MSSCLLLIADGSHHSGDANHGGGSIDGTTNILHMEHGGNLNRRGGGILETADTLHTEQDDYEMPADDGAENNELIVPSDLKTRSNNEQQSEGRMMEQ